MKTVGVFCGSSMGTKPAYREAARELGLYLVEYGLDLVYGGANVGLMKVLSDTVLEMGGKAIGVMPRMLVDKEVAHLNLTEMHIVQSMSERKVLLIKLSDAFVAMPGGFGTLDELAEVITNNQLRLTDKPIGLLNIDGYYDYLLDFFDHGVREGFLRAEHRNNIVVEDNVSALMNKLDHYQPVSMDKWIEDIHRESNSATNL